MTAWVRGARLDQADFAERFFGRAADDPVVRDLRGAAIGASTATSHAEIREAAGKLAEAMQAIGLYQWPRFVADAQARARDPATVAAIENSRRSPDVRKDAIRPVYPVETLLGIGAAGVAGGVTAAARAAGRAVLKQALPEIDSTTGGVIGEPVDIIGHAKKPLNIGNGGSKPYGSTKPSLPANPDDLLAQGWKETTHPGEPGWRGQDHYHVRNPNTAGRGGKYLDREGRPVPNGSKPSHIPPDR
jgi:hypothetical protein